MIELLDWESPEASEQKKKTLLRDEKKKKSSAETSHSSSHTLKHTQKNRGKQSNGVTFDVNGSGKSRDEKKKTKRVTWESHGSFSDGLFWDDEFFGTGKTLPWKVMESVYGSLSNPDADWDDADWDEKRKKKAKTETSLPSLNDFLYDDGRDEFREFVSSRKNRGKQSKDIKMKRDSSKIPCGIYFDFKTESDMFKGSDCNHPFCTSCISTYVAVQTEKNTLKVNCPKPKCSLELKPEFLRPILPKHVSDQWELKRCELSIDWREKTYCPFENCSVLLVNDEDGGEVVTSCECPSCHRLFCAQCKVPWHAQMNFEEFQKLKRRKSENEDLDSKFFDLAKRKKWKRCPKCSIFVKKGSGCEHIKCRCGNDFCYICGKDWKHGHICLSRQSE